jgi:hypothetical protein
MFCTLYQLGICTHRGLSASNIPLIRNFWSSAAGHRTTYFLSGLVAGFIAIYIEQKPRRAELALYSLPKAMESFYAVLLLRKVVIQSLPAYLDLVTGMTAFAILMGWYQQHPKTMSPIVRSILQRLVGYN